jgi:hypothetical protein
LIKANAAVFTHIACLLAKKSYAPLLSSPLITSEIFDRTPDPFEFSKGVQVLKPPHIVYSLE